MNFYLHPLVSLQSSHSHSFVNVGSLKFYPESERVTEILTKIILVRIKEHPESLIDRIQTGFCIGSFCIDHIDTLQIIVERYVEFRFLLHLLFVDFEKAFVIVNREFIRDALWKKDIPEKLTWRASMLQFLQQYDYCSSCSVIYLWNLAKWF